jgi:hypothetical protein
MDVIVSVVITVSVKRHDHTKSSGHSPWPCPSIMAESNHESVRRAAAAGYRGSKPLLPDIGHRLLLATSLAGNPLADVTRRTILLNYVTLDNRGKARG